MNAMPASEMDEPPVPKWLYPPEGRAWTVDDLDNLPPEAPRRLEIIDGALVIVSPQTMFHSLVIDAITHGLRAQAPEELMVMREWTVALPDGDAPEPDVVVFDRNDDHDLDETRVDVEHVRMAVEVVSPDSRKRDLFRKPLLYADAGIEHYWIVDREDNTTVVRTYHGDPRGGYQPVGEYRDRVVCSLPFEIELDLSLKALDI